MNCCGALDTWVDWADIVAGIATAGALAAAAIAARYAKGVYEIETARDLAQSTKEERAQAQLVSAWLQRRPDPDYNPASMAAMGDPTPLLTVLHIANLSTQPIYKVMVESLDKQAEIIGYDVLPPETTERQIAADDMVSDREVYSVAIALTFTDAAGKRWRRTRERLDLYELPTE